MEILISCEHGGNEIPKKYQYLFAEAQAVLNSHRGIDFGALDVFQFLQAISCASFASTTSRLLVELNRSMHHKSLFSEFTKNLSKNEKEVILNRYYFPYRSQVESTLKELKPKLHISVHSFTPVLNHQIRHADIGLLYNPQHGNEKEIAKRIQKSLQDDAYKVRLNYPYLGTADGFTTYLRKTIGRGYAGIELEVNQKFASHNQMDLQVKEAVFRALNSL